MKNILLFFFQKSLFLLFLFNINTFLIQDYIKDQYIYIYENIATLCLCFCIILGLLSFLFYVIIVIDFLLNINYYYDIPYYKNNNSILISAFSKFVIFGGKLSIERVGIGMGIASAGNMLIGDGIAGYKNIPSYNPAQEMGKKLFKGVEMAREYKDNYLNKK